MQKDLKTGLWKTLKIVYKSTPTGRFPPVAAIVLIVADTLKVRPHIIKRTSVPMISDVIFMFVLSMIIFL